ncbi:MAG: hypothetical protein D8M59_15440 [Planctomycetes bacterium]|nr:hypothetical protein [Planctomycetota bacterium]NOG55360.1 VanZ family protein [Planctomycetota bacterium]
MTEQRRPPVIQRLRSIRPIWWRTAFVSYAVLLYVATHLPQVHVSSEGAIPVDKQAHVGAYAIWTFLAIAAWPARRLNPLVITAVCCLIAAVWAGFDEITQALPIVHRHAQWSDWFADLVGVVLAGVIAGIAFQFMASAGEADRA